MKTYKQYAEEHGISYNAVYQSVQAHRKELKKHLHKKGRTTFMDEEGEAILDQYRKDNPIVVVTEETQNHIKALEQQINNMHIQIETLQAQLIAEQSKHLSDVGDLYKRIDELTANQQLLEDKANKSFWKRLLGQ